MTDTPAAPIIRTEYRAGWISNNGDRRELTSCPVRYLDAHAAGDALAAVEDARRSVYGKRSAVSAALIDGRVCVLVRTVTVSVWEQLPVGIEEVAK